MEKDEEKEIKELIEKVNEKKIDLSSGEDLSIAIMNLISIEEHLYFTYMKTKKKHYLVILNSVRKMRKELLEKIVKNPEGEIWCISKHLLAASMRLIETGNKYLKNGNKEYEELFRKAFELYSLFWAFNLGLAENKKILENLGKNVEVDKEFNGDKRVYEINSSNKGLKQKFSSVIKKIINCCKE